MQDVYERVDELSSTHTNAAIALETGLSESTVSRLMRGLTQHPGRPGRPRSNPRAFERGRKLWVSGLVAADLVSMLPVSRRTVYRWIQAWKGTNL